jgi:DNA-binding CsgD family transcriptional regulator
MAPHFDEDWFPPELFRKTTPVMPGTPVSKAFEPEAYVWQVHGKPVMVHLNLDVVDRLQQDLFEATYYGNEVNGILLGGVAVTGSRLTFFLEDYELVSDNTPNGSSALAKQKQLADIAARWKAKGGERHAIGLFRSQTRGWLALAEQDIDTAKCLFPRTDNIFLVVRSSPGAEPRAGFFFWEENHIRANESYSEFAFDSSVLRTQSSNRIHVLDAEGDACHERARGRALPASWLTIGLTWGVALASTLTCVNALNTAGRNPRELAIQAAAPVPTKFEVDYHGQKIKVNMNHGLPSDLEREDGPLSDRQRQLLRYVADDLPNHDIAFRLGLAPEAVEVHKQALSHKLGVAGDAGLVRYAIKSGLVQP